MVEPHLPSLLEFLCKFVAAILYSTRSINIDTQPWGGRVLFTSAANCPSWLAHKDEAVLPFCWYLLFGALAEPEFYILHSPAALPWWLTISFQVITLRLWSHPPLRRFPIWRIRGSFWEVKIMGQEIFWDKGLLRALRIWRRDKGEREGNQIFLVWVFI